MPVAAGRRRRWCRWRGEVGVGGGRAGVVAAPRAPTQAGEAGAQPRLLPHRDVGRRREIAAAALEQPAVARAAPAGDAKQAPLDHRLLQRPGRGGGAVDQPGAQIAAPGRLDRRHLEGVRLPRRPRPGSAASPRAATWRRTRPARPAPRRSPAARCPRAARSGRRPDRRWPRSRCRRGPRAGAAPAAAGDTRDWPGRCHRRGRSSGRSRAPRGRRGAARAEAARSTTITQRAVPSSVGSGRSGTTAAAGASGADPSRAAIAKGAPRGDSLARSAAGRAPMAAARARQSARDRPRASG